MFDKLTEQIKTVFLQKKKLKLLDIASWHEAGGIISYTDLFDRKFDGAIIRNFYSPSELAQIKQGIKKIPSQEFAQYDGRYTAIPPVFESSKVFNNPNYFMDTQEDFEILCKATGVDFRQKNIDLFKLLSNRECRITSPQLSDDQDQFVPGCMRILPPDYGIIRIHADNDFYTDKEEFYSYFQSKVDTSNHISHIAMIDKPEKGGNLTLHHIEFDDYYKIDNDMMAYHRKTGKSKAVRSFESTAIELEEGDLALFSGGQIWHSVNKMEGLKNRITYGGFSAYSHDRKTIYSWT